MQTNTHLHKTHLHTMAKVIKSLTSDKMVRISTDAEGNVRAAYVQVYNREEDLIQLKSFANVKKAEAWAKKILGL
jgi:hypothetical protein